MPSPSSTYPYILAVLAALTLCPAASAQGAVAGTSPADTVPDRQSSSAVVGTSPADTFPDRQASSAAGYPLADEAGLLAGATVHALTAPARWRTREWAMFGGSLAGIAVASIADEDGRALMAEVHNAGNTRVERFIEPFGAERSLQILGGMLVAGLVLDDGKLSGTAVEGLAAGLVAAGIVTPTLQKVIGRSKPREGMPAHTYDAFGGHRSLPSGHTTQAFAVASVIATEYDHPLMQIGVYGIATAVGVSRMYRRSHFLSDVVGAAIIGTVVGRTVARYGIERRGAVSVAPSAGPDGAGLTVRAEF